MNIRVVLDVNVLASAVVFPIRIQGRLVSLGLAREFDLVLSGDMVRTLQIVIDRPYFQARTTPSRRARYISALLNASMIVSPDDRVSGVADDEEDDRVLGTAVEAGADFLVTGDHGLLAVGSYEEVSIVTAREFLAFLDSP